MSHPKASSDEFKWEIARAVELPPLSSPQDRVRYNFKSGAFDSREFPFDIFSGYLNASLSQSGHELFKYGSAMGHEALIEEIGRHLFSSRQFRAKNIIVTHGSQEAIFLVAQVLLKSGDAVAVELLNYIPALRSFEVAGAELVPIEMDDSGMLPNSLEKAAQANRLKLIYLTPLHQFPTTATLTPGRRKEIYEIAVKYGIAILEDDYDPEFFDTAKPLSAMAANDPDQLIFYMSTLSKIVSGSSRIGFIAIPDPLVDSFCNMRRLMTRQNDLLWQDALARWMRDGYFEKHLKHVRQLYSERRPVILECLETAKSAGHQISWKTPLNGMSVWIETFRDSQKILTAAKERGVYFGVESEFRIYKGTGTHIRLGLSNLNEEEIRTGLSELFNVLENIPI